MIHGRDSRATFSRLKQDRVASVFRHRLYPDTADDPLAIAARICFDRFFVQCQKPPVTHNDAPFDDHSAHVRGFGGVNQIGIDVVVRGLIKIVEIDDDQIGALPFFD